MKKRKVKYPSYDLGGILKNTMSGASTGMILGPHGAIAGASLGLISGIANTAKEKQIENSKIKMSNYGGMSEQLGNVQFELGGKIHSIKEFKGNKHSKGGINIDKNMNESIDPIANVENQEIGVGDFIFSNVLTDQKGKSFAKKAKKIAKLKGDSIANNTKKFLLERLSKEQENLKTETNNVPMYELGTNDFEFNPDDLVLPKVPNEFGPNLNNLSLPYVPKPFGPSLDKLSMPEIPTPGELTKNRLPSLQVPIKNNFNSRSNVPLVPQGTGDFGKGIEYPSETSGLNNQKMGSVLKGVELATLMSQAFQKPVPKSKYLGDNRSERKRLAGSTSINLQELMNENQRTMTSARQQVRDISGGTSQMLGNLNNISSQEAKNAAMLALQARTQNNQYRLQEGQVLGQLDSEQVRAQDIFDQNTAARQKGISAVGTSVGNLGEFLLKKDVANKMITQNLQLLNTRFSEFGLDMEAVKRLQNGTYTNEDFIKFKTGLTQVK